MLLIFQILLFFTFIKNFSILASNDAEDEFPQLLPFKCKCGKDVADMKVLKMHDNKGHEKSFLISPIIVGKGAIAKVFHAVEWDGKTIGNCVALKVPLGSSEENFLAAQKQFENESKILEKLNHQEIAGNVEKFFGIFSYKNQKAQQTQALALEFGKETLDKIWPTFITINHHGQNFVPEHLILPIFERILVLIHEVHKNSIIHTDIKPTSFISVENDVLKLIDFGGSKMAEKSMPFEEFKDHVFPVRNLGVTKNYCPPEVHNTKFAKISSKLDIWAFGTMGVELLLHNPIFIEKLNPWFDQLLWAVPRNDHDNQLKALYIAELVAQVSSGQLRQHNDGVSSVYFDERETRIGRDIVKEIESVYPNTMGLLKKCFALKPVDRPTAAQLIKEVKKLKSSNDDPRIVKM